jgi:nitroimidazol reductase NimA-like FMN-containing flavoprotein (pyridoxamine 5'-phosphate oxidase superfamily)
VSNAPLSPTPRSTLQRHGDRAAADRTALYEVLDAGLVCHLSIVHNGAPVVLPTGYGRDGDTLYLHGSTGSASMRAAALGVDICVAVTLFDGVVYARSVFHHSINYRSAVVHGRARELSDEDAKLTGLRALTEHLAPGSWAHTRLPTRKELAATSVLTLDLTEASVKIRTGHPVDEPEDVEAGTAWAGVLPLEPRWGAPIPSNDLPSGMDVPAHILARAEGGR